MPEPSSTRTSRRARSPLLKEEPPEFGTHPPVADLGPTPTLAGLKACARAADALGYTFLYANDHLMFSRPWVALQASMHREVLHNRIRRPDPLAALMAGS